MSDKIVIPMKEFDKYGVSVHAKTMIGTFENCFALRCKDGANVTITQAQCADYWQSAHSHKATRELYFVWSGALIYASLCEDRIVLNTYKVGEFFSCEAGVAHTVFVDSGTVFGTAKFQLPGFEFPDYELEPEMDKRLHGIV
ncbi:hypothetical protein MNBD_CPR01-306 [hydrothermal vent metagenome]|uniref:Cupin 2 conserved barrel domain-containing protein n=1 Tax=hydrothermal vent metagenome TaxID=652676 RepID=A0A3B0UPW9_9ZZZZ